MVEIQVTHMDNTMSFHPIEPGQGWRVDAATRQLIIGRGLPRTHIPLDNVRSFDIVETAIRPTAT